MHFLHAHLLTSIRNTLVISNVPKMMSREMSQMENFKDSLKSAKKVVIISGDGIGAESGLPVYGSVGHWRNYQASSLATPGAFLTFPSLVWEFYHYRREMAAKAQPNKCHKIIAEFEAKHEGKKSVTVITQTIDGLHARAGTKNLIELHGNLFKTRCIKCNSILTNHDSPIGEALLNKGKPDVPDVNSDIPEKCLPHCNKSDCGGLLRPHVVWFGESLEPSVVEKAEKAMLDCDLCLVVGRSSLMFPAAIYAPEAAQRGAIVAEFNTEPNINSEVHYYFEGPCSEKLSEALSI